MNTRRSFLKIAGLGVAAVSLSSKNVFGGSGSSKKPNIIFIFSDDHANNAISAYGSKINKTPNIDRIVKEGAIFQNSFCANSICQPSRANILTGVHSHMNGVTCNGSEWNGSQTVFPRLLKKVGYQTALIGKWHMHPDPSNEFDFWKVLSGSGGQGSYYNPDFMTQKGPERIQGYSTDVITDQAMEWLDNRDKENPFMLMVQFKSPHVPRRPAIRHAKLYEGETIPAPPTLYDDFEGRLKYADEAWMKIEGANKEVLSIHPPEGSNIPLTDKDNKFFDRLTPKQLKEWHAAYDDTSREYYKLEKEGYFQDKKQRLDYYYQIFIKNYIRCVAAVDENVGRILEYVKSKGLEEDTIVIYSSDQSYFIGEHGWAEKRWMYEEGLKMPFVIKWPGKIKPGTEFNEMIQNIDYAPTFLDAAGVDIPERMQGKSLVPVLVGKTPGDWRKSIYYHYYDHGQHNVPRHEGVRTEKYKLINFYTNNEYEMYDLEKDQYEMKSVYGDPKYAEIQKRLHGELKRLRKLYEVPEDILKNFVDPRAKKKRSKKK